MDRTDWSLAILMGGIHFSFHLFMRLVPALIPLLVVSLSRSYYELGLLVSVFFIGSSVGLLPMGVLSDAYDRRWLLAVALGIVGVGYALFALAPTLGAGIAPVSIAGVNADGPYLIMVLGMGIAGLGTSAHVPVGVPLLTANANPGRKGTLLGVWGGGSKLGDAAGPAIVGVLILAVGWRPILFGFAGLGLLSGAALFAILTIGPFETTPPGEADAADEADTSRSTDRRRFVYPMVVLVGYFAAYTIVVQGVITFTPTFVTVVYGFGLEIAGRAISPESFADFVLSTLLIAAAASRFVGGVLTDRYEHRLVLIGSLTVAAVALVIVAVAELSAIGLVAALVVFGAGLWGNSPARDSLISDLAPAAREGRTFSYLWTASRGFGALGPAAVGWLADSTGIRLGFAVLAGATGVAALIAALLFSERVYIEPATVGRASTGERKP